jgi:hypothetical protein
MAIQGVRDPYARHHLSHSGGQRALNIRALWLKKRSTNRQHGNLWGAANCRTGLAGIALAEGDRLTFRRFVLEALEAKRASGDNMGVASCLQSLARDDMLEGDLAGARTRLRESLMTLALLNIPSGIWVAAAR